MTCVADCATLRDVANTPSTGFRFAPELLERLDRYAARLSEQAGVPVSRAAAAAKLLGVALAAEETAARQRVGSQRRKRA